MSRVNEAFLIASSNEIRPTATNSQFQSSQLDIGTAPNSKQSVKIHDRNQKKYFKIVAFTNEVLSKEHHLGKVAAHQQDHIQIVRT